MYAYSRNSTTEYYRQLKDGSYGYFPATGESNDYWFFEGTDLTLLPVFKDTLNPDDLGETLLTSRPLNPSAENPPPTITIGRDKGYSEVIDQLSLFVDNADIPKVVASLEAFEASILLSYGTGSIIDVVGSGSGQAGEIYRLKNASTLTHDYFLLKHQGFDLPPNNQQSNNQWKYLGSAEDHVNVAPIPASFERHDNDLSMDERVASYYGIDQLLGWEDRETTTEDRQVFVYANASLDSRDYFMQRTAAQSDAFPENQTSSESWIYITSNQTLEPIMPGNITLAAFDQLMLDWYRQDALRSWDDEKASGGVKGEIFFYNKGGKRYYQLKKNGYGYFPDAIDNNDWDYLGSFNPE
nr:hypothetical protein [Endozoicomonas sp.]